MSISRAEAIELRNALEVAGARGSSAWRMNVVYADVRACVILTLELDVERNDLSPR